MSLADIKNKGNNGPDISKLERLRTEEIVDKELTLINVGTAFTKNGECGVLIFEEYPDMFWFGGNIIREKCKEIMADNEALEDVRNKGTKVIVKRFVSESSGRGYYKLLFVD